MDRTEKGALFQDSPKTPGTIRESSLPTQSSLPANNVLIRVHAWAINPADAMLQDREMPPDSYPLILGCDIAGAIVLVPESPTSSSGSTKGVEKFKPGDRVFGVTANNGFQDYISVDSRFVAKISENMAYSDAAVLGLCSVTAGMYLFGKEYLALDFPKLFPHPSDSPEKKNKTVLVWGGSSAVGSNAIQLATAAGYTVLTTCSPKNFDYVKSLGAVQAFSYSDPDAPAKIAAELDASECAGIFMAAGLQEGNIAACKVAAACTNGRKLPFATSSFMANLDSDEVPDGVDVTQPPIGSIKPFPECWVETIEATFGGYMVEALAQGRYKPAPAPLVVNRKGLEGVQEGVDLMRAVTEGNRERVREVVGRIEGGTREGDLWPFKIVVERA